MVQAGVESSPESSSSSSKKGGDKDADDDADATRASRIGFINNNGLLWARDHRTVTGLIFAGTLVAFWERMGFSIAFTDIATEMRLTETEKGSVFAAYYFGFALTQVPGGYLANRYGGKTTLALSFLLWTPASALMALPSGSSDHVVAGVVACRLVIGMAQGILLPAAQSVLGHWVPPAHRGRYFAFAMSGMFAGAALAMVTVPTVVSDIGAPTTFYIAACLGAAWLAVWVCAGSDAPRDGGEAAGWLDAAQGTGGIFSAIHKRSGLEEGGDRPKDHWAEAGMTLDATPKPWAFINPSLSQSFGLSSASDGGTPTGPGPPTRARPNPPARPRVAGDVVARASRPRLGDPTRVTCAAEFYGFVSPISRTTVVGSGAADSTIRRATGGGGVREGPRGGESGSESGAAGTTAPATPAETRAKLVRAAFASGYAVSGSGIVADTVEDGRGGRGIAGKQGSALCSGGKDHHGAGVGTGDENGGCSSWGIRTHGDLTFSVTSSRSDLAAEGTTTAAAGAVTNAPSSACEEGKSAVPDGRSFGICGNLAGGGGGDAKNSRQGRWNVRGHAGSRRTVSSSSGQTPVGSVSSSGSSSGSLGGSHSSGRAAVGRGNGRKEVGDSIVRAQFPPAFAGKDPPAKDTALEKTGAVFGRSSEAKPSSFPWRAMSVSPAAWACVAGNVGAGTGINVVMSWLPTYFEEFFLIDLKDIGLASLLAPYLTMMVFSVLGGVGYCWLTNTRGTSTSRAAKLITGFSFVLAVGFFLSMGLATSHSTGTVLSSLALASVALSRGGWSTNHVEIAAPEHAAMLYSVANSVSSASSVVGIAVTGKILDALGGGGQSLAWMVAMGTIGAICGACGVFFVVFAEGDEVLFPAAALPGKDIVGGAGAGAGAEAGGWRRSKKGEGRQIKIGPRRDDMA